MIVDPLLIFFHVYFFNTHFLLIKEFNVVQEKIESKLLKNHSISVHLPTSTPILVAMLRGLTKDQALAFLALGPGPVRMMVDGDG